MAKTYLFDVAEPLSYLREQVRPYLGRAADFISATSVLGGAIDIIIYGRSIHCHTSPTVQLTDLGAPFEVARNAVEELCSTMHLMFARHLGVIDSRYIYEWDLNELTGTLTLQLKDRSIQPIPPPTFDVIESYRASMKRVLEEGGWVSESVRRNLGI